MSAIELWKRQVKAHHAQSIKAQGGRESSDDFWIPFAQFFRDDPRRTDDTVLNRLLQQVKPEATVLDVGGGGGRYAIPLALRCRHVTVVEPSQSMLDVLQDTARQTDIHNITIVQATWEEAKVQPADIILCAHVLYGVEDIAPFLRKLHSHATDRVLILMHLDAPRLHLSPLWVRVHGEDRINLPGLRGLLPVLWEMDICPDLEMLPAFGPVTYDSREDALEEFHRRLYVTPGTHQDRSLDQAMHELLEQTPEGLIVRGSTSRPLGLLSWQPE